jgi:hypothetical protein
MHRDRVLKGVSMRENGYECRLHAYRALEIMGLISPQKEFRNDNQQPQF